ncbi:MAG: lanthionine synthetase LanC family protein [Azospirillaceae bacterium]
MVSGSDLAVEIGWRIARRSIRLSDGRCGWMGHGTTSTDGWRVSAVTLGPGLYDGLAGIALFLATLHRRMGDDVFADLSRGALKTARDHLSAVPPANRGSFYLGWTGIAWATTHVADLIGSDRLRREGEALMRQALLSPPDGSALDLLQGAASALAACMAHLDARPGDAAVSHAASQHAHALVDAARWDGDMCAWPLGGAGDGPGLCGLSHGASGIAAALLAYHQATGDAMALRTAIGALAFEERHFDETEGSWADRRPGHSGYPALWCHGAGGGALAHRIAAQLLPSELADLRGRCVVRAGRASRGLASQLERGMGNDSLCHGVWGLIACRRLLGHGDSDVIAKAKERLVRSGVRSGLPGQGWTPSLMLGDSGVGLAALALEDDSVAFPPLLPPGLFGVLKR